MSKLEIEKMLEQQTIDFDKHFIAFLKLPPEIIQRVISYIRKDLLTIFLDCNALVPFILPYIERQVEIVTYIYKITGPLLWSSFELNTLNMPQLSMTKLKELMDSYKICPKEATIDIRANVDFTNYQEGNNITSDHDEENREAEYQLINLVDESLDKWCEYNQEILGKVKNWRLQDKIYQRDGAQFLSKLNSYMNLMSFDVMFPEYDDVDPETQKEILNCIPESVSCLSFDMKDGLINSNFLKYSYLRKLKCPITSRNQINLIPPSVESLNIYAYNEAEVMFLDTDKVPPNLKEFAVITGFGYNNIEILIKQMDKLGSFKICQYWTSTRIESLCLPDSNITNLVIDSCGFDDYSSIRKYKGLKRLKIIGSIILLNLLVSEDDFPNMQELIFMPSGMVNPNYLDASVSNLEDPFTPLGDKLVFPPNLANLEINSDFIFKTLNLPRKLNSLTLSRTIFPNGITFKLPDTLRYLKLSETKLRSLDDFHFPTNLEALIIHCNRHLKSMTNTNLSSLGHLYFVDFFGNRICDPDKPRESNRYKYNTFNSSMSDENDNHSECSSTLSTEE